MDEPQRGWRVTIADVAALAGVSKTTVSHVLSGNRPVSLETRQRVERAVEELGYRPDGLARSLRTQRTQTVALVIPDITNPFYPVLARGLEDRLRDHGYRAFICNTDGVREQEVEYLADVSQRRVDGIVLVSFNLDADALADVFARGIWVVVVGSATPDHELVDVVLADDERGAFDATSHLVAKGHRRVAMISGAPGSGLARNAGYRAALEAAGIAFEPALTAHGDWTRDGGAKAMRALLDRDPAPTGVFCANDLMAIGAMDVIRDRGLSVPDDVAVVGYDDIDAACLITPSLTTMLNPAYETGCAAAELLLERMRGADIQQRRTVVIPVRLIERASS